MTERSLVKKLAEVMSHVGYIPKNGYNAFHKYKYVTEADVSDKVRDLLAERNVMMIPSVVEHKVREYKDKGYINTVLMEFVFHDGDSDETLTVRTVGEAQDATDKGCYKAMTGATKYALMKAFMIPTGDDPELSAEEKNESKPTEPRAKTALIGKAQQEEILRLSKESGQSVQELAEMIYARYGKTPKEITVNEADDLIHFMDGVE